MPRLPPANDNDGSVTLQAVFGPLLALLEPLLERVMQRVLTEYLGEMNKRRLLTDREIAVEVLGCSIETLRTRLLPAGVPHVLVGDARRYDPGEVLEWLRANRGTPR
jgi:hypothetical protein